MAARIGVVLSGSTTRSIVFEVLAEGEERLCEGMLVVVGSRERLLARVDSVRFESSFYRPGDVWSEARRHGFEPPKGLGCYCIAEAHVLGRMTGRGLDEPRYPPRPGDPVYLLEPGPEGAREVYGVAPGEPGVVWYGSLVGYEDLPLALSVEALTMHLGVFGETGSGKSYGFGYLLELLSRIPTGIGEAALPAIVVDANGDYLDYWLYARRSRLGCYDDVVRLVMPRSPQRYQPGTRCLSIDLSLFTSRELAEFVIAYKTGGRELPEMQVAALERLFSEAQAEGLSVEEMLTTGYHRLLALLDELSSGRGAPLHFQTARAARAALDKFRRDVVETHKLVGGASGCRPLDEDFLEEIVEKPSLVVVDFSDEGAPGVPLTVKQLVIAYLARRLYTMFTRMKLSGREAFMLFAIEEAQNYAPNTRAYPVGWSIARDQLSLLATQGRKFGVCLAVVSQRPAFVDPVVVSMLNTMIIHRLSPEDVAYISRIVGGLPRELERRLTSLPRGYALVVGQANMLGHPVLVRIGRRLVGHRMGTTRLVDYLKRVGMSAGGYGAR